MTNSAIDNITNKVVIVTGASSGIGEAVARHLAFLGASVVLGARRGDRLDALVSDIRTSGGKASALQADVTRKIEVEALVAHAVETFGTLDVIVNNAGLMAIAPLAEASTDEWDRMIDVNIKGVLYGIAAALPIFYRQGSGHFINIGSVVGRKVFSPGGAVYSGTKFAVHAISEGLRHEVGGSIRTTIIAPGAVDSEAKFGSSHQVSRDAIVAFYEQAMPAEGVARAVVFAIEQPAGIDINEILLRPTAQDF